MYEPDVERRSLLEWFVNITLGSTHEVRVMRHRYRAFYSIQLGVHMVELAARRVLMLLHLGLGCLASILARFGRGWRAAGPEPFLSYSRMYRC